MGATSRIFQFLGNTMNRIRSLRYLLLPLLVAWLASASADGAAPAMGSAAPEFKLQDQNGKWHELKDYRGKWVALYFYPKDQTAHSFEISFQSH